MVGSWHRSHVGTSSHMAHKLTHYYCIMLQHKYVRYCIYNTGSTNGSFALQALKEWAPSLLWYRIMLYRTINVCILYCIRYINSTYWPLALQALKEWALGRRVSALSRFLLDHLHK